MGNSNTGVPAWQVECQGLFCVSGHAIVGFYDIIYLNVAFLHLRKCHKQEHHSEVPPSLLSRSDL